MRAPVRHAALVSWLMELIYDLKSGLFIADALTADDSTHGRSAGDERSVGGPLSHCLQEEMEFGSRNASSYTCVVRDGQSLPDC